jgi:hypothetical protein
MSKRPEFQNWIRLKDNLFIGLAKLFPWCSIFSNFAGLRNICQQKDTLKKILQILIKKISNIKIQTVGHRIEGEGKGERIPFYLSLDICFTFV